MMYGRVISAQYEYGWMSCVQPSITFALYMDRERMQIVWHFKPINFYFSLSWGQIRMSLATLELNNERERMQKIVCDVSSWLIWTFYSPEIKYGCPLPHSNLTKQHKSFTLIILNIHPIPPQNYLLASLYCTYFLWTTLYTLCFPLSVKEYHASDISVFNVNKCKQTTMHPGALHNVPYHNVAVIICYQVLFCILNLHFILRLSA